MESQSNLISVVIPFYSTEKGFLERSVKSVLKQDYQNFEIIVVDDCSPINAIDELSKLLPNEKIQIFRNKTNRHGAYSRNYGIEQSNGKFIALLDADDYWDNDHLSQCMHEIKDYDFIYSNIQRVIGSNVTKIEVSDVKDYKKSLMADILLDSPPQTNSFFFRKSCYPTIKFDESLRRHQDYQFFLTFCLSEYRVKKINAYTTYYVATDYDGKIIDYNSINQFWMEHISLTSPKKIYKFLISIIIANLRNKETNFADARKTCNLLPISSFYKRANRIIKSNTFLKLSTYIYYYLYLDMKNFPKRLCKIISRIVN